MPTFYTALDGTFRTTNRAAHVKAIASTDGPTIKSPIYSANNQSVVRAVQPAIDNTIDTAHCATKRESQYTSNKSAFDGTFVPACV